MKYSSEKIINVNGNDCDAQGNIHINRLVDYTQIIEMESCEELGIGKDFFESKHISWMLLDLKLSLNDYHPKEGDKIKLKTWSRGVKGLKFYRDTEYYLLGENEIKIGACTSEWIVASSDTHKPLKPNKVFDLDNLKARSYDQVALVERIETLKTSIQKDEDKMFYSTRIAFSDLDTNVHMHNTNYIKYACDGLANFLEYKPDCHLIELSDMTIKFKKEIFYKDIISIYIEKKDEEFLIEGCTENEATSFLMKIKINLKNK